MFNFEIFWNLPNASCWRSANLCLLSSGDVVKNDGDLISTADLVQLT